MVSGLPSVYFRSKQYTKFWNEKIDSGNWQICINQKNKMKLSVLLQKTGINFEKVMEKDFSNENSNYYKDQIFLRLVLKEGGKDEQE